MQLSDLLPTSEQIIGIQGVEKSLLQRRRYGSRFSVLLAFLGMVLQVALIIGKAIPIPNLPLTWRTIGQIFLSPESAVLAFFGAAAIVYMTIRYTGFLVKESKEPFRYTFDIKPFTRIDATPAERYSLPQEDYLNLLHVDIMERLNRRIKRLSLLEDPSKATVGDQDEAPGLSTHIHIEGKYAIREDKAGGWVLQVLPEIRIGPESKPSTLGYSIRHSLAAKENGDALSVSQFEQLTERVYSSVATEIYRQIQNDVENKMGMFPTDYLQAVARYCEARDFENSNTIDSYDRALELYRTSIHAFDVSVAGSLARRLTAYSWVPGWRWFRPALQAEARARLGYARCMIYRRFVSELGGRSQNPVFEIRGELDKACKLVKRCYNSLMPSEDLRFPATGDGGPLSAEQTALNGILEFPDDRAFRARRMDAYHLVREELCETHAVSALGYTQLFNTISAQAFLKVAESLQPGKDANRALIKLAKSFVGGNLRERIAHLRQAKELAPDSEIISYRLAIMLDMLGRSLNHISRDRIDTVRREYASVLKINPGNVSCLIGQGYLSWLVGDLDTAESAYSVADDLKDMVSQTFVGDLKYGLARVAAERASQALEDALLQSTKPGDGDTAKSQRLAMAAQQVKLAHQSYEEAVAADPAVAACDDAGTRIKNGYFSYICDAMLERYRQFKQNLTDALDNGNRLLGAEEKSGPFIESLKTLRRYALNDYGGACINYYLRFDLRLDKISRKERLNDAIDALELATEGRSTSTTAAAQYNLAIAYGWRNDAPDSRRRVVLLKKVVGAFPNWQEAIRTNNTARIDHVLGLLQRKRDELADLKRRDREQEDVERRRSAETAPRQTLPPSDALANAPSKQSIQMMRLCRCIDLFTRLLESERKKARKQIFENTLLDSIGDTYELSLRGSPSSQSMTSDASQHWDRLGDAEAGALSAWVQISGRISSAESTESATAPGGATVGSSTNNLIELCQSMMAKFYAEDYLLLQTLIFALKRLPGPPGIHQKDYSAYENTLQAFFEREESLDPDSQLVRFVRNAYSSYDAESRYAEGLEHSQKVEYEKAVKSYSSAIADCPSNDLYHSELSLAFERWERQLLDDKNSPSSQETLSLLRNKALSELKRAAELDPENTDYRERLVSMRMRQWVVEHDLEQALDAYQFCDRMKIELSASLVTQLVDLKDSTLNAGLLNKIAELRKELTLETGVLLPGVKFTDNRSLAEGKCRILIRDVPTVDTACVVTNESETCESIVAALEQVATSYAAEYFSPQDAIGTINKLRRRQADFTRLLEAPGTLGAATIILKGLLSEQVPISDLDAALRLIHTETAAGVELLAIHEHVRSLPEMRSRLPGNDAKTPLHILRLSETLEREMRRSINKTWGATTLNAAPSDIERWLGPLQIALNLPGNKPAVGIVTCADVRPFLCALTHVSFPSVPVLSDKEILTPLLVAVAGEIP